MSRWPLRYRLAHRLHCHVNKFYRAYPNRVTEWLNAKAASLWNVWWVSANPATYRRTVRRDDPIPGVDFWDE